MQFETLIIFPKYDLESMEDRNSSETLGALLELVSSFSSNLNLNSELFSGPVAAYNCYTVAVPGLVPSWNWN